MEVTVRKVDGRLIAEVPAEALQRLGVTEGETLIVESGPGTLSLRREATDRAIETVLREDRDVLAALAASERMDMVDEIMDEYAPALEELAK